VAATDEMRFHHPSRVRWGVVCGDGEIVWARDEAAARRLLVSLVGAIRIVCEQACDDATDDGRPAPRTPITAAGLGSPPARAAWPYPR
jgi:hypothetical protein